MAEVTAFSRAWSAFVPQNEFFIRNKTSSLTIAMSSFPWDVSTHLHTATMVPPSIDPIGFLLTMFDFALGWLGYIVDLLLLTVNPTVAAHVLSSSTQLLLSPFRTLSMWIHGAGVTTKSNNVANLNNLEKDAFFFDRTFGILARLPPYLASTNTSTSGEAFPDLPFFKATLISICLMFVMYRAYQYGKAATNDEGPTGAVAEVVAALSSENHELRSTIDRLTARIKDQGQDGASSSLSPGVYVFNAGTASSVTQSKDLTADSLNTPHPSCANLPEALQNHHGSHLNDTTRCRRRSLSADTS